MVVIVEDNKDGSKLATQIVSNHTEDRHQVVIAELHGESSDSGDESKSSLTRINSTLGRDNHQLRT
jgi:hypothetical protein